MNVHFVCVGNSYRSRLAEAVLNALAISGMRATSSGTHASDNENGPISWYGARLLKNHGLIPFMSPSWTQTTPSMLAAAGLVVFMADGCRRWCSEQLGHAGTDCEVWQVADLDEFEFSAPRTTPAGEQERIAATEATFALIERLVTDLVGRTAETKRAADGSDSATLRKPVIRKGWAV
jgi:protein-tyrosine-phosphatase